MASDANSLNDTSHFKMGRNLTYVLNHVFFPLKLPQKSDSDDTISAVLIEELLAALRSLQAEISDQEYSEWTPYTKMLSNMLELRDHSGGLIRKKLETKLKEMMVKGRS